MHDSLFDRVGGEPFFAELIERFYQGVERDPILRPLYPPDLRPSRRHLAMFLAQYWGGPPTYNAERGHPRLRMRHAPFAIGQAERDAWLRLMHAAVSASPASEADKEALQAYFESAATSLINQFPERGTPGANLGIVG
jgi:hemoglobin